MQNLPTQIAALGARRDTTHNDSVRTALGVQIAGLQGLLEEYRTLVVTMPTATVDSSLVLYPKALMEDWHERKPSVVFVTDNVRRTCDRLTTNGVTISQPVVEMAWGDFAAFLDTEGNEFGLRA